MRFIDSHCHLTLPELASDVDGALARMRERGVEACLTVCVTLEEADRVRELALQHPEVYASVGVHPDYTGVEEPDVDTLVARAAHERVVAIGETGLDYFRLAEPLEWQRRRLRTHIRAARACGKPLIIHTRASASDTLAIMREEDAARVGGVMHCFTETQEVAEAAIAMNFMISFSGIVTFKNARDLQRTAAELPLDRILIETDAPYLAPVPHRGESNEPAYVVHVAEKIAAIRGCSVDDVAAATSRNFRRLFLERRGDR